MAVMEEVEVEEPQTLIPLLQELKKVEEDFRLL